MLSKQLNKDTAEVVTIVVKNVDAATITTGLGVQLMASGASCDGVSAVRSAVTTYGKYFAGISRNDIPVNGFGNVVCWGLADSVQISNVGTSITVTSGDNLWPSALAGQFFSSAANDTDVVNAASSTLTLAGLRAKSLRVSAVDTANISGTTYIRGLVRAL